MPRTAREKLVSESVQPVFNSGAAEHPLAVGEPLVPQAVVWRGISYPVVALLSSGKGLGPCSHGSGERYVHKHWYRFETTDGRIMRVYFERRPRSGGETQRRWWLYTIEEPE